MDGDTEEVIFSFHRDYSRLRSQSEIDSGRISFAKRCKINFIIKNVSLYVYVKLNLIATIYQCDAHKQRQIIITKFNNTLIAWAMCYDNRG